MNEQEALDRETLIKALVDIMALIEADVNDGIYNIARDALDEIGWEPSEAAQGLIPIPDGYAEQ